MSYYWEELSSVENKDKFYNAKNIFDRQIYILTRLSQEGQNLITNQLTKSEVEFFFEKENNSPRFQTTITKQADYYWDNLYSIRDIKYNKFVIVKRRHFKNEDDNNRNYLESEISYDNYIEDRL